MNLFVSQAFTLKYIRIWSSYTQLEDVDQMISSERIDYVEYIKTAAR